MSCRRWTALGQQDRVGKKSNKKLGGPSGSKKKGKKKLLAGDAVVST